MPNNDFDLSQSRLCVIMNLGSGRKDDREFIALVTGALQPLCAAFELRQTQRGEDLTRMTRQAVSDGFKVVIAAGGDGTLAAVAGVLAGTDTVMGVLPGGTFNYFARDLGVGETPEEALETLRNARIATVDIGQINDLVFLNNVSLGIYPHILKMREGIYRRWGRSRIAAYGSVLISLRRLRRPMTLTARIGDEVRHFTTALVFVARSAYQLESFGLEGADAIRKGQFAVLIARARKPLPLIRSALRLVAGLGAQDDDFDLITTDELTIQTRKSQHVAHDGEKNLMHSPLHLRVRKDALRMLLPAEGRVKANGDGA
ncbi:diacylglycerol kinase family protein [Paracoccus onubensis]|uniref:diacylglycerol/lipid kinase family protein n=1 Tax=Paracoccus onubensis TaxID=1675788 RepID=UPI0027322A4A|nr:diacylglycerol kinase family protein [Paracoccus onubensis]MDP0925934.1 diacylglycerol kinase family protein [Paracoccus onubensis]